MTEPISVPEQDLPVQWAKVIDNASCIGCHACTTACKSENEVPLSVTRTYVKYVDVGIFPQARRAYQVTRCNQCANAPCTDACPTRAMYRRADGIVDFDKSICIGCKACIAACPYDAIFINPEDHSAEKCNFCAHRIDVGLEPACVVVCPTQAILVGDLHHQDSKVGDWVNRNPVSIRRPEKNTNPQLYYHDAHQTTLDPLAARRPDGGLFMWSEQVEDSHHVVAGHPGDTSSSAEALLSYDVPHSLPWDWRVSLYTLTKGIAAGAYLVSILLLLFGWIEDNSPLWQWVAPLVSGLFLAITGALLISDLEHPARFFMIFTRSQWKSWLVRGAYVIGAFSLVLGLHFGASLLGRPDWQKWLVFPGLPLAVLTSVYTAYLFAQAKARDLWQSPLLPPHMLIQTLMAGSSSLLIPAALVEPDAVVPLGWIVALTSLTHVLFVVGEITLPHGTAHVELAVHEMTSGRFRPYFRAGMVLALTAVASPWLGPMIAAPVALIGLVAFEHAYVQAGQSVPLA
jgi:Fe-S-cluster-containing dehydrogenase component/formate-dependent nitrite reductase membrane component NrfD